jgi:outer membrane protein insertion porin family
MNYLKNKLLLTVACILFSMLSFSQVDTTKGSIPDLSMSNPGTYELGGITVTGVQYLDPEVIAAGILKPGIRITVPGEDITNSIIKLWKQQLYGDIKVKVTSIIGNKIYLEYALQEKPRLTRFSIKGLRKGEAKSLREELSIRNDMMVTENLRRNTESEIKLYFAEKGYQDTKVEIKEEPDSALRNHIILRINVDKGPRIKIEDIVFTGNDNLSDKKLRKLLKKTKRRTWYNIFAKSKFVDKEFQDEKTNIIHKYNSMGFRDAYIISDSIYKVSPYRINLVINISEGHRYYFRNIRWVGNTKYRDSQLDSIINIRKGDPYDQVTLDSRLNMNPSGYDVSSLYMDRGYLFFQISAVEVLVENDSIDLEIRISEGARAINNKITVKGNTKTSDKVVLREIRTRPGEVFSRADITRTLRELAQLGYFDQEKIGVNPVPNQATGTVDIEYIVEEKPSDQIELSGGWGQGNNIIGTLGLTLNNFSARKLLTRSEWTPIPSGDGQRLTIRAQSTGFFYQSYNASFSEPWLGGKKTKFILFQHLSQQAETGHQQQTLCDRYFHILRKKAEGA